MKKIFLIILAAVAVISVSVAVFAQENKAQTKVIAYYFHGSFRCPTCRKLEQYSKEAIENNFQEAIVSGKLRFEAVNVEDKGNEHFADQYKLYTKSLILSLVKDGKEVRYKNLDKIWTYVREKDKFIAYIKADVDAMLKEAE